MAKSSYQNAVVRTYPEGRIPDSWAREMEKWMGKEVTLKIINGERYTIAEDPRWSWEPDNFILLDGGQLNPNFLFKHKKIKNNAIR
jgi:hypothetical protein